MPFADPLMKMRCDEVLYMERREGILRENALRSEEFRKWRRFAGPCERCGEIDERVLEFHHENRDTKKFQITHQTWFSKSLLQLIEELAKCKVLCANCHRKEEYDESGKWGGRKIFNW